MVKNEINILGEKSERRNMNTLLKNPWRERELGLWTRVSVIGLEEGSVWGRRLLEDRMVLMFPIRTV